MYDIRLDIGIGSVYNGCLPVVSDEGQPDACGSDGCRREAERAFSARIGVTGSGRESHAVADFDTVVIQFSGALQQFVANGESCRIVLLCSMDGKVERCMGFSAPRLFGVGGRKRMDLFAICRLFL